MHLGIPTQVLNHTLHEALITGICTSHTSPREELAATVSTVVTTAEQPCLVVYISIMQ